MQEVQRAGTRASPSKDQSRASLLPSIRPALQLPSQGRAGTNLGAAGGDGAGGHCHPLLVVADTAGTAVGHRAAQGAAGGLRAGTQRDAGDVPGAVTGAQLAGEIDVEGSAGGDAAAGEALHLAVALQVGRAGAGLGARGTAGTGGGGGCPLLRVPLGARRAGAGLTGGFWGRRAEQEAGEGQAKGAGEGHGSGGKKGEMGAGGTTGHIEASGSGLVLHGLKPRGCSPISLAGVWSTHSCLPPAGFALNQNLSSPKAHPGSTTVSSTLGCSESCRMGTAEPSPHCSTR